MVFTARAVAAAAVIVALTAAGPASSQPATGQMPCFSSARSRRKLGGATAMTPLPGLAAALPALRAVAALAAATPAAFARPGFFA